MTYQVDVLNPKAIKLLQDLGELDLISITQNSEDDFLKVVNRLRKRLHPIRHLWVKSQKRSN